MIILGIDPGTATTGYALIKKISAAAQQQNIRSSDYEILDFGVISTSKLQSDSQRLLILQKDIQKLIKKFKPQRAGVEKLYFEKNAKSAMAVSQARGVVLLALEQNKIPLQEFTPLEVKSIICGYGKADKKQVQFMIQRSFNLKKLPKPDDAADALGIALCAALKK
jgi:crossover junction endodeoxyribonuclease RuvC